MVENDVDRELELGRRQENLHKVGDLAAIIRRAGLAREPKDLLELVHHDEQTLPLGQIRLSHEADQAKTTGPESRQHLVG
jgi:hypothetical protein